MATLADVVTKLQALGTAAINAMQSDVLRKVADFIDQEVLIQKSVDAEMDALNQLAAPPEQQEPAPAEGAAPATA